MWIPPQKEGKRYRYRNEMFWAKNGLIATENILTGEYKIVARKEFLLRAYALNKSIAKMMYCDERDELQRGVENMLECCKEARSHGDPFIPGDTSCLARQNKRIFELILPPNHENHKKKIIIP